MWHNRVSGFKLFPPDGPEIENALDFPAHYLWSSSLWILNCKKAFIFYSYTRVEWVYITLCKIAHSLAGRALRRRGDDELLRQRNPRLSTENCNADRENAYSMRGAQEWLIHICRWFMMRTQDSAHCKMIIINAVAREILYSVDSSDGSDGCI